MVRLRRRSSSSLPEARQLINSQLGACFPTKVGIKIRKTVSFSFTYGTGTAREKGDTKGCESLFSLPPLPPTFPKPESSRDRQSSKSPSGLRPWKLSPFFIWSCPPVAMVTQHLLPQLCSSGHWIWHLPSYCWFCGSPPVLLCSRRIVSHFSCRGNIYAESRLQREEGLNLCVLGSRGSRRRLACGAINSSNL